VTCGNQLNLVVVIDVRVVRQDPAADIDRHVGGNDAAHAAPREPLLPVHPGLGTRPVVVVDAAGNAAAEHPILDGEIAEHERLTDRVQLPLAGPR
jgi:hypothetical protein